MGVLIFAFAQSSAGTTSYSVMSTHLSLMQHRPQTQTSGICVYFKLLTIIWKCQHSSVSTKPFEFVKNLLAFLISIYHLVHFGGILTRCQYIQGPCYMGMVRNKPSIIICEPRKFLMSVIVDRYWPVGDGFYFLFVSLYTTFESNMPEVT